LKPQNVSEKDNSMTKRLELWCLTTLQQYISFIVAIIIIGGGNRNTWRNPQICRKPLTNFITLCCVEYTSSW